MRETIIYEKNGVFHNIVKQSGIMQGRYHILPTGSKDLNVSNISGLELPTDKYPLVAALPPRSSIESVLNSSQWEFFDFQLLFLCKDGQTGNNQIKDRDPNTNTSLHTIPNDWADMKEIALGFMNTLDLVAKQKLQGKFRIRQGRPFSIIRMAKMQTDHFNGVMLTFSADIVTDCISKDFGANAAAAVDIPDDDHPYHKH